MWPVREPHVDSVAVPGLQGEGGQRCGRSGDLMSIVKLYQVCRGREVRGVAGPGPHVDRVAVPGLQGREEGAVRGVAGPGTSCR